MEQLQQGPQTVAERMTSYLVNMDRMRTGYLLNIIGSLETELADLKAQIKEKEAIIQKMAQEKMGE